MQWIKNALAWVWRWVTVISATLIGGTSVIFELVDDVTNVDLTPLLPTDQAARIITLIAIAKAVIHAIGSGRKSA